MLNSIQSKAVDPVSLHEEYGDKLCFDSTFSMQRTKYPLEHLGMLLRDVISRLRIIGCTGLILDLSHAYTAGSPPENIVTI